MNAAIWPLFLALLVLVLTILTIAVFLGTDDDDPNSDVRGYIDSDGDPFGLFE